MTPIRIQRKRSKGWRMPENTVYVGRGSVWGNPFKIGVDGDAKECVKKYIYHLLPYRHAPPNNTLELMLISEANLTEIVMLLKGKNLACWCALDHPCHADFLMETANAEYP